MVEVLDQLGHGGGSADAGKGLDGGNALGLSSTLDDLVEMGNGYLVSQGARSADCRFAHADVGVVELLDEQREDLFVVEVFQQPQGRDLAFTAKRRRKSCWQQVFASFRTRSALSPTFPVGFHRTVRRRQSQLEQPSVDLERFHALNRCQPLLSSYSLRHEASSRPGRASFCLARPRSSQRASRRRAASRSHRTTTTSETPSSISASTRRRSPYYQDALRVDPGMVKADYNLALTFVRMKRSDEAVTILKGS